MNDDIYGIAITGERFIDGIVDHFVHEMMQAAAARAADVHTRAFANRLEPFEHLNVGGTVGRGGTVVRLGHLRGWGWGEDSRKKAENSRK